MSRLLLKGHWPKSRSYNLLTVWKNNTKSHDDDQQENDQQMRFRLNKLIGKALSRSFNPKVKYPVKAGRFIQNIMSSLLYVAVDFQYGGSLHFSSCSV